MKSKDEIREEIRFMLTADTTERHDERTAGCISALEWVIEETVTMDSDDWYHDDFP